MLRLAQRPGTRDYNGAMHTWLTGVRALVRPRRRATTAGVVVVLALSVGVAASVFNLMEGVLLRLPDLPRAGELAAVSTVSQGYDNGTRLGDFEAWRAAGIHGVRLGLMGEDLPLARRDGYAGQVEVVGVSAGMFGMLGVRPALGRGLVPQDPGANSEAVVVISRQLFNAALGGDAALVGRAHIQLNRLQCRVIGVMPDGFHVPRSNPTARRPELWAPLPLIARLDGDSYGPDVEGVAVARMAPGVNRAAVEAQLSAITLVRAKQRGAKWIQGVRVESLQRAESGEIEPQLLLLGAGAAAVLLLGFLNAACLLGAVGLERRQERAIRIALGASRGRLRAQSSIEGAALGFAGGAAGVLLAALAAHAVGVLASWYLPRPEASAPSASVMLGMLAAAGALGAVAGAASGGSAMAHLRAGTARLRLLAAAEIALSVVLVAAAALVTVSFVRLETLPTGFSTRGVVYATMMERQHAPGTDTPEARAALIERTLDALRQQPALSAVAVSSGSPTVADAYTSAVAGWRPVPRGTPMIEGWFATPGFFQVLRIPVLEGSLDQFHIGSPVVAVDHAAAVQLFGSAHAVGRRLSYHAQGKVQHATVVAGVGDLRETQGLVTISGVEEKPHLYVANPTILGYLTLLGRAPGGAGAGVHAITAVSASLDAFADIQQLGPLADRSSHREQRFQFVLALAFALLALAIGLTGVFAFMARRVAAQRRELAVRLALGDTPQGLFARVLREAAWLGAGGVLAGMAATFWTGDAIRALLFEVSPTDPRVLGAVACGALLAAAAAAVTPALRAARTDPNQLLRDS